MTPHKLDGFVRIGFGIDGPGRTFYDTPQTGQICPDRLPNRRPLPYFLRFPRKPDGFIWIGSRKTTALAILFTIPSQTGRICPDRLLNRRGSPFSWEAAE
jgi:hypothetical protein